MIKCIFYFFICLLFGINHIFSQTIDDGKAHRRYWYYRARMINDFMKIGKEQGACIVFAERNNGYSGGLTPEFQSKIGPDQIDITNMYIMTLALEYKLLSRNGQDTRETIKELFHMLYSLNRLDLEAEQYWTVYNSNEIIQPNGLLNGFMLREDMPYQFMTDNLTHYNYELLEHNYPAIPNDSIINFGGFTGLMHTKELTNDNKFTGFLNHTQDKEDLTLVQDKYMSMLVAMEFINKYIPSATRYISDSFPNGEPFQDGEISIKQEAGNIANRCYNYLRNKNGLWQLRYMDMNGDYKDPLTAGAGAFYYSWPLSRMACNANTPFPWNEWDSSPSGSCQNYNDAVSTTMGRAYYNGFTLGTISCADDNAVFKAWCHAGSNSPSLNNLGAFAPIYVGMGPNAAYNSLEWAELLRKVLHQDGALTRQMSIYSNPINQAPCQGPYNYGNCNNGGPEWSSQDRLEHPNSRNFGCNGNTPGTQNPCYNYIQNGGFQGNYPGVDYMLLHNLYYEYQNQLLDGHNGNINGGIGGLVSTIYNAATQVGNAVAGLVGQGNGGAGNGGTWSSADVVGYNNAYNYMDNIDENIWPRKIMVGPGGFVVQGIDNLPGKVAVFQYLKSRAHIYHKSSPAAPSNNIPSNVTYRAGKEIIFEPGFEVDAGSTFHGYIARYICSGNSDAMAMRQANVNDSLYNYLYTNDYEGDDINPIPIHYVESPKSDSDLHPVVSETSDNSDVMSLGSSYYIPNGSDFIISPNPSNGIFKIQSMRTADSEKISVRIFDMKGQLIFSLDDINDKQEINLTQYSKGIYLAQILSSVGSSKSKKIEITD